MLTDFFNKITSSLSLLKNHEVLINEKFHSLRYLAKIYMGIHIDTQILRFILFELEKCCNIENLFLIHFPILHLNRTM